MKYINFNLQLVHVYGKKWEDLLVTVYFQNASTTMPKEGQIIQFRTICKLINNLIYLHVIILMIFSITFKKFQFEEVEGRISWWGV